MPERRRKFTPGLKDEAVKMVIETSRPITEIARDIHVNEGTRGELGEQVPGRARRRRAGIERLRAGSAARTRTRSSRVADEDGVLGKSGGLLRPGVSVSSKYEFIDAEKALYPIVKMCEWMAVSTSGFYEWRGRPSSATNSRRAELRLLIGKVFADSDDTYGYRRVQAELTRLGVPAGPELVRALMRELDLRPCQPRPWRPTTTVAGDAATVPDLLRRDFTADRPGVKLVGDITYIPTWQGWLFWLLCWIRGHDQVIARPGRGGHMPPRSSMAR